MRVVYAREDVVRLGPKRPPISATAVWRDGRVRDRRHCRACWFPRRSHLPYGIGVDTEWRAVDVPGPPVAAELRAFGLAEQAVLVEGALDAAGVDRSALTDDAGAARHACRHAFGSTRPVLVSVSTTRPDDSSRVEVRVAAGDPLDETVLRSYALGAVHMALGWVLTESIAVDPETGEVHDLTIRSFGIIRARDMPPVSIAILDDAGPPRARSSDAVFAAVAAATWNALARAEGVRPDTFPARDTRASRLLRR